MGEHRQAPHIQYLTPRIRMWWPERHAEPIFSLYGSSWLTLDEYREIVREAQEQLLDSPATGQ